ncbi:NAD(P)-binding protein [Atractiella rhizophila]|nr:NAD(P)-binding protein [Atractiella rhizophila]
MSTVYVITGAGKGLGLGFVRFLSSKPSNIVYGIIRNSTKASELKNIANERKIVTILVADCSVKEDVEKAAQQVADESGHVDVLINNAAISCIYPDWTLKEHFSVPFTHHSPDNFLEVFKINTLGPIIVTQAFLPLLRHGQTRRIAMISSIGGLQDIVDKVDPEGVGSMAAYSVSKTGLNMVTRKLAIELRNEGFTFGLYDPGKVKGGMAGEDSGDIEPEESARLVVQHLTDLPRGDSVAFFDVGGNWSGKL